MVGGNLANLRYSTLTKIDKSNINQLGGAWMVHVEQQQGLWMQATPVVVDGIMYMATGHIAARDARTGALKWQFPKGVLGPGAGREGGPDNHFNRGVVVAEGKVFSAASGTRLIALDQNTGDLVWQTNLRTEPGNPVVCERPSRVSRRTRLHGCRRRRAGRARAIRRVRCEDRQGSLEVLDGPGPGEFGHDTWEGDSWKTGGAPVWTHPAIDPELGLVYVPTGQRVAGHQRHQTRRRQPVLRLDCRARSEDRRAQVALPGSPSRSVGLRRTAPPVLADITYQGSRGRFSCTAARRG